MTSRLGFLPRSAKRLLDRVRAMSIATKTFATLSILLSCFGILGVNSYLTMTRMGDELHTVGQRTLPKQTIAMSISEDIVATHMKVFRFVTLASNGVNEKLLSAIRNDALSDLTGETVRLTAFAARPDLVSSEKEDLDVVGTKWAAYLAGVKDLMDVGIADAAMAAMMLRATDEDFQVIANHLAAMSSRVNTRTTSVISNIIDSVYASKRSLVLGGTAGLILSMLVAMGFVKSLVKPIQAVTRAMRNVSSGDLEGSIGYASRTDEIGQMVQAIARFRRTTQLNLDTIASQSRRFDVALNNMSHGLCMFDKEGTLIVGNKRFQEIYGLPGGGFEPGCTLRNILRMMAEFEIWSADCDKYIGDLRSGLARDGSVRTARELEDGRIIHVVSQSMADGGWISIHEDVTERVRNEERVAYLARNDSLTGLPNRLQFRERAEELVARARRGEGSALLCIDLDHFKEVNDSLGHPSGDALLKLVAERLRKSVRETDVIARLGGDEFAVLQTGTHHPEDVAMLADRIVQTLSEPYDVDGHEAVVGASVGIAVAPGDGTDADQLLKNADMALYRAKSDGRSTFRFFEAEMDARLQARRKLEMELRKAVVQGEFEVYYQPIVSVEDNRVTAFEALIRWNHPERGLVMPGEFISVAEDIGLIGAIGEWVLRQACATAATWQRDIRVAVNLSPSQFRKTLVPSVLHALAQSGLRADRLELEITESVLLQNNETTISMLNQLHDIGVRISMDDFGTGYSSLSYLHSFPFDKIKIDRSFVADLGTRSECAAIVRAVAGLGSTLGIRTTAEGVETLEQLELLRSEGCSEAQGYLFSRPRPAKDLSALISELDQRLAA